ncbi:MAG TPA: 2-dehydropantoate 2-reductase [Candidatus Binatus sp.]|nr:2-dehydropantoate 2-reductase [Candidatus Binatus sp.]
MRIGVMGSGAVGGYFGAKLARNRHQVAFLARGAHLAAMRANGLQVKSPNGDLQIHDAQFTDDAASAGQVDLILFCVKSYDTEDAAETIKPMVADRTIILSLQNGIDNPAKLARVYGKQKVLPAVVYVGTQLSAPGVISHTTGGRIVFGPLDGAVNDRIKTLEQTLNEAGIPSQSSSEIRRVQWTKLLWNAPFCAISCLIHADTKQIVESESLVKLAVACMTEVQTAARLDQVDLAVQLFDDVLDFSRSLGDFKPSMLQDLEAGKPLEYEAFNGYIVRLLKDAGQPAPVNECFYRMLKFLDARIRGEARN